MSQSDPMPNPNLNCRECGAVNDPGASECWLCNRRDWRGPSPFPMSPKPAPQQQQSGGAWPIIALVLGLVVVGGVAIAPGLIIVLLIFSLPAWGIAEWIAYRRRRRGQPMSIATKAAWIVGLAIGLPVLLGVALFITVWMICLVNGAPNFH
jgi:hypothetical protein